ncbi:hypothetical protein RJ640_011564 [Escallonia rubra]|uniref:Mediator of RNA polymerase II transcription subunit 27 n=1 Tax=Escallonia rubra TaxID=112253 RepID=A0AA88RFJ5_9ASTE|nr:hypothetical protein RJ640_011564 [Escallonia rubra]
MQSPGVPTPSTPEPRESTAEAPPKQVAQAMDRLAQAGRLIADIRLGADRLLEALFVAAQSHQSTKPLHLILKEEASMRHHLQHLRTIGRQLEESGVLNESLRSRSNSWGLHMPLVCPDGAVVAYAWKRQLAGQAGASAVDRTRDKDDIARSSSEWVCGTSWSYNLRLALKAFTDQKRRFFPHLDDGQGLESVSKKHCGIQTSTLSQQEELSNLRTVSDILQYMDKEVPNVKISTYQRLQWFKQASSLASSSNETFIESSKEQSFHSTTKLRQEFEGDVAADKIAVIELLLPSVFRAVISLHPAGSIDPDAVAFFSPDEGGSYVHPRGFSVYHVFRHITVRAFATRAYKSLNMLQWLYSTLLVAKLKRLYILCWYYLLLLILKCFSISEIAFDNLFMLSIVALDLQLSNPIRKTLQVEFFTFDVPSFRYVMLHLFCSKCRRLLSMDKQSALLLPPVQRPYRDIFLSSTQSNKQTSLSNDQSMDAIPAYHVGCFLEEA